MTEPLKYQVELGMLLEQCSQEYGKRDATLLENVAGYFSRQVDTDLKYHSASLAEYSVGLAQMTLAELGLDAIGVSAALLLQMVRKQQIPEEELRSAVGERVSLLVHEWLKIAALDTAGTAMGQEENMRNLILTLATDFRVILMRLADRLFLMRNKDILDEQAKIKVSSEARYIFSPLAHRLGLYNVMSEMEDISMSVLEKDAYDEIARKLKASKEKRESFIKEFIAPIQADLEKEKIKTEIKGRPKAISSIWRKMRKQKVEYEEVYDKFAIRIIIDTTLKKEKAECWRVYSMITDYYQPNPERLRDWISAPKSNGYESLHTTVVVPGGEWVEIQIRTRRMDEIAEKGLAAHWKYKGIKGQAGIDQWIQKVRETLENSEDGASNLMEDLQLSQFSKEIFVFTPGGDLKKFPENATVLDFAFDIHTDVGSTCVGARINGKNVPIRHPLQNGDKVEILRAKNQKPKADWLNFVVSSKAKGKIKQAMKEAKLKDAEHGKEILKRRFRNWKIEFNDSSVRRLIQHYKYKDAIDLYFDVSIEKIDLLQVKELLTTEQKAVETKAEKIDEYAVERLVHHASAPDRPEGGDYLVIDEKLAHVDFKLARCCNPIHGDSIFGFVTVGSGITIHRTNCPNAQQMLSRYGYRVVKARWNRKGGEGQFPVTLQITGLDDIGIVSNISDVISKDLQVNMRSISIDSNDGLFEGSVTIFVTDTKHLDALIKKLQKVKGVNNIRRVN